MFGGWGWDGKSNLYCPKWLCSFIASIFQKINYDHLLSKNTLSLLQHPDLSQALVGSVPGESAASQGEQMAFKPWLNIALACSVSSCGLSVLPGFFSPWQKVRNICLLLISSGHLSSTWLVVSSGFLTSSQSHRLAIMIGHWLCKMINRKLKVTLKKTDRDPRHLSGCF